MEDETQIMKLCYYMGFRKISRNALTYLVSMIGKINTKLYSSCRHLSRLLKVRINREIIEFFIPGFSNYNSLVLFEQSRWHFRNSTDSKLVSSYVESKIVQLLETTFMLSNNSTILERNLRIAEYNKSNPTCIVKEFDFRTYILYVISLKHDSTTINRDALNYINFIMNLFLVKLTELCVRVTKQFGDGIVDNNIVINMTYTIFSDLYVDDICESIDTMYKNKEFTDISRIVHIIAEFNLVNFTNRAITELCFILSYIIRDILDYLSNKISIDDVQNLLFENNDLKRICSFLNISKTLKFSYQHNRYLNNTDEHIIDILYPVERNLEQYDTEQYEVDKINEYEHQEDDFIPIVEFTYDDYEDLINDVSDIYVKKFNSSVEEDNYNVALQKFSQDALDIYLSNNEENHEITQKIDTLVDEIIRK